MKAILFHVALILFLLLSNFIKKKKKKNGGSNEILLLPTSPPSLPVLGHLHLFCKPLHRALSDIADRFGPVVALRFGSRPVVSVSSPALATLCLASRGPAAAEPLLRSLSPRSAAILADETRLLLRGLERETQNAASEWSVGSAAKVELKSWLFAMAADTVARTVVGRRCYGEGDVRFRAAVKEFFAATELAGRLGWARAVEIGRRLPTFAKKMDVLLQGWIEERRSAGCASSTEESLISLLLSLQQTHPLNYSDSFLKDTVMTFITRGTDTLSNTVEWAMALLLNNPEKLKKAVAEIDGRVGPGRLVSKPDLARLPYLRCVVAETLRLYPAAPLVLAAEGTVIDGYYVPKGAAVLVNLYAAQRSPEAWPEPDRFVPERFEGSGPKGGLDFGQVDRDVGLVLGSMLQCFQWERVGREEVDMKEAAAPTALPKLIPLQAVCMPRPFLPQLLDTL